ncbi:MAG: LON peptidase substrate-binding domain-containing protein, partial [Longimicrobiales bacterium]
MATLKRVDGTYDIPSKLPVVALRDLVYFPYMVLPLLIGRDRSVAALKDAEEEDGFALLVAQKQAAIDLPEREDLYRIGTVVRVLQTSHLADGTARVVMEGLGRARIKRFLPTTDRFRASIEVVDDSGLPDVEDYASIQVLVDSVEKLFREYVHLSDRVTTDALKSFEGTTDP